MTDTVTLGQNSAPPGLAPAGIAGDGSTAPLIYLVAGEVSGDLIAARLMAALRRRTGGAVRFAGIGGPRMAEQGLASDFPMAELSLMGLAEVLPHLPRLIRRVRQTVRAIRAARPAAVLFVDASAFARAVARRLGGAGVPRIQYKAPQAWAYWSWRAKRLARLFELVLAILPFEPAFFARFGVTCRFIGHPAVESGAGRGDGPGFRRRHAIPTEAPLLCLLPGSRSGEIAWSLPAFAETVARLAAGRPGLRLVVPTVEPVAARVAEAAAKWPLPALVVTGEAERYDAFAASDAALAASGTVSVELALAGVPMAVCYRLAPLSAWLARRVMTVRHVSVVNLVLDRPVIPELLQAECRPDRMAAACRTLLDDAEARTVQRAGLAEAAARLSAGGAPPAERAAEAVLDLLARR